MRHGQVANKLMLRYVPRSSTPKIHSLTETSLDEMSVSDICLKMVDAEFAPVIATIFNAVAPSFRFTIEDDVAAKALEFPLSALCIKWVAALLPHSEAGLCY